MAAWIIASFLLASISGSFASLPSLAGYSGSVTPFEGDLLSTTISYNIDLNYGVEQDSQYSPDVYKSFLFDVRPFARAAVLATIDLEFFSFYKLQFDLRFVLGHLSPFGLQYFITYDVGTSCLLMYYLYDVASLYTRISQNVKVCQGYELESYIGFGGGPMECSYKPANEAYYDDQFLQWNFLPDLHNQEWIGATCAW